MLQPSTASSTTTTTRTLLDRVGDALSAHRCTRVWVRGAGRHVLLSLGPEEPFARITALGGGSYGLAFQGGVAGTWEPLLVDTLSGAVEHALIGGRALPG
jgi:hypothetical protein